MRKILWFLFVLPFLSGCNSINRKEVDFVVNEIEVTTHNYYEVSKFTIVWQKIFDVGLPNYYVYCYSPTCSHCADLKDWIIEKALERENIYFVKASEFDVITKNVSNTIGVSSADRVAILGYPSLLKIENNKLVQNVAGKTPIQTLLK